MDVAALADLLRETAEHHDPYEKRAPKHDWWDWYAAYMIARQQGTTPRGGVHCRRARHDGRQAHRFPMTPSEGRAGDRSCSLPVTPSAT